MHIEDEQPVLRTEAFDHANTVAQYIHSTFKVDFSIAFLCATIGFLVDAVIAVAEEINDKKEGEGDKW